MSLGKKKILSQGAAGGVVATDNFNTVLYSGNSSTQSITGVGFQPDLTWIKARNAIGQHSIFDSVRGVTKRLDSSSASAEATVANSLTSFNSDGFSFGNESGNNSGENYVAWNWYCPTSFSHSGSGTLLASSGKSNQDAGISIVKFDYPTGNSSTVRTVKHNLSTAPDFILYKPYIMTASGNSNWFVYHKSMGDSAEMYLNLAIGKATDANRWNATAPTGGANGVVTLGTSFSQYADNFYGGTTLMYCIHDVAGYQKVGSYTGTGNAGNTVDVGFTPSWLMTKRSNSTGPWMIFDNKRNPSNPRNTRLGANLTAGDASFSVFNIDFDSTSFTLNGTDPDINGGSDTYIYLAIA